MPRSPKQRFVDPSAYAPYKKAVSESAVAALREEIDFHTKCIQQQLAPPPPVNFSSNVLLLQSIEKHNPAFYGYLRIIANTLRQQGICEYDTHDAEPIPLKPVSHVIICQRLNRYNSEELAPPREGVDYNSTNCSSWGHSGQLPDSSMASRFYLSHSQQPVYQSPRRRSIRIFSVCSRAPTFYITNIFTD